MSDDGAPFELHPQLAADSLPVVDLQLCCVRLMNDARYPWLLLVPRRNGLRELIDLDPDAQRQLLAELDRASRVLQRLFAPDKLNLAALGNMVPQLHWHLIARNHGDEAWPAPVWGRGSALPYDDCAADRIEALRQAFAA